MINQIVVCRIIYSIYITCGRFSVLKNNFWIHQFSSKVSELALYNSVIIFASSTKDSTRGQTSRFFKFPTGNASELLKNNLSKDVLNKCYFYFVLKGSFVYFYMYIYYYMYIYFICTFIDLEWAYCGSSRLRCDYDS